MGAELTTDIRSIASEGQLFLRLGYSSITKSKEEESIFGGAYSWSFGLGLRSMLGDLDISVDYAYRAVHYFGGNHLIGIILGF